jgi:hypothetical protein
MRTTPILAFAFVASLAVAAPAAYDPGFDGDRSARVAEQIQVAQRKPPGEKCPKGTRWSSRQSRCVPTG